LTIYADSSFLVSAYIQDAHSTEVIRRMRRIPAVWLTPFNRSEIAYAIHQHIFRGTLAAADARRYWSEFEEDCEKGVWAQTDIPPFTWEISVDLARKYGPSLGVRTLDSLHVACALELGAERFWTFDERQAKLAKAVGLSTKS
jgi:predicted nucleic acid-binding protein